MKIKIISAQSTLEYVIFLTALIVCILWAANAVFKPAIEQGLNNTQTAIENVTDRITP